MSVYFCEAIEAPGLRQVVGGRSYAIYPPLLLPLIHHLHVQFIEVIQVCTPMSKFIQGSVLLAAILLVDKEKID